MSQLQQLKQQINALAQTAKSTGGSLAQFDRTFKQQISQVQATIGGSAQSKDQAVIDSLTTASKQVNTAVQALQQAAATAQQYGNSL